jgi:LuxR family transcriptional regulator, maltose regulon positive regulatory protein
VAHVEAEPIVEGAMLRYGHAGELKMIEVGTAAWFSWLAQASRFVVVAAGGRVTVRKEQAGSKRGGWYWRAYRKQHGRLRRVYLGPDDELTTPRLEAALAALLEPAGPPAAERQPHRPDGSGSEQTLLSPLLAIKYTVPSLRQDIMERPALVARLRAASAGRLTLLLAPAGFGKTTLLAQTFANSEQHTPRLAWLALDRSDNQAHRLLVSLWQALNIAQPGVTLATQALLEAPATRPEAVVAQLAAELAATEHPINLVIDDYHLITDQAIDQLVTLLLDYAPPALHIIVASRSEPRLPLARLRARGDLAELHADTLQFTLAETQALFRQPERAWLSDAQIAALAERTEGWPAGLRLAALALERQSDPARFVADFAGTHRFIMDYLVDDVLRQLSPELRQFLLTTAILDRLSASLCDALLDAAGTPAPDAQLPSSQQWLETIERQGLFLTPLDHERRWFRYHQLFAEVLRAELRQARGASHVAALHKRAAQWYATQVPAEGIVALNTAMSHALAAGDTSFAAELVAIGMQLPRLRGERDALQHWLALLPDAVAHARPALRTAAAPETPVEPLTAREHEVLELIAEGVSNAEIARRLVLSVSTVKTHIHHLFGKLAARSRTEAVARAREHGLL